MHGFMRASWFLASAVFGVFAYLQANDPDAALWVAAYALPSGLCLARGFGRSFPRSSAALCLGYGVLAFLAWPPGGAGLAGPMDPAVPGKELARESLGLGICALALMALALQGREVPG